jgi:hypothetical protein
VEVSCVCLFFTKMVENYNNFFELKGVKILSRKRIISLKMEVVIF